MRSLKSKLLDAIARSSVTAASRMVKRDRRTYLSYRKLRSIEQELGRINRSRVPGDILEFGVALGGSAIAIAKLGLNAGSDRRFHGLDVFEMIPPPGAEKDDDKSVARYAEIASGRSKGIGGDVYYGYRQNLYADVCKLFETHSMPVDGVRVAMHKGLFEKTWPSVSSSLRGVAFAHIDCDWYDPVRFCLASVGNIMSPGGAIVLDDYFDYGGCRAAADEFLSANKGDFSELVRGGHLVLRKN